VNKPPSGFPQSQKTLEKKNKNDNNGSSPHLQFQRQRISIDKNKEKPKRKPPKQESKGNNYCSVFSVTWSQNPTVREKCNLYRKVEIKAEHTVDLFGSEGWHG
jgi:hypothetical protein